MKKKKTKATVGRIGHEDRRRSTVVVVYRSGWQVARKVFVVASSSALGKDVNCGLSGFHVILPTLKRKLPSGTVTEWKTFVKDKKDDEIHSDVFLAFLLEQARIKDTDIGSRTKALTKGHQ
ncbi:hypothetical protein T12_10512 [Trichinella patagoniensis]|uniref:Uncharacterized protein n=1 Tax=Trichinella patagoniensis TaxID=990121 RepID=A0A0V1ACY4_9BILA|nr:hypothetical protein T12_10512 [Trichinella patagoniensis]